VRIQVIQVIQDLTEEQLRFSLLDTKKDGAAGDEGTQRSSMM
jgi:hypothetical protein